MSEFRVPAEVSEADEIGTLRVLRPPAGRSPKTTQWQHQEAQQLQGPSSRSRAPALRLSAPREVSPGAPKNCTASSQREFQVDTG